MAMNPVVVKEQADNILVTSYAVQHREGVPALSVRYVEVKRAYEDAVTVDGVGITLDQVVVSAWAGRTDLVGRLVCLADGTPVGKILTWDEGTDLATLDTLFGSNPTGTQIQLQARNLVGAPAYRLALNGAGYEIGIPMHTPEGETYAKDRMGAAFFAAAKALLTAMGVAHTDADIVAALNTLGAQGTSIDSFLAQQGEQIHADYVAGTLPFAYTMGPAPTP